MNKDLIENENQHAQKKYKIGVFVGKFLPPHLGHTSQIEKCLDYCETLFVVVADSKKRTRELCKESGIPNIFPKTRLLWLKKHFQKNKNIKFFLLDQGMLEAYPNYLDNWKRKFLACIKEKPEVWFVDKNYLEISKKYFPEFEFIGFDRTKINISATDIRNYLNNNSAFLAEQKLEKNKNKLESPLDYIIPEAKEFFENQGENYDRRK